MIWEFRFILIKRFSLLVFNSTPILYCLSFANVWQYLTDLLRKAQRNWSSIDTYLCIQRSIWLLDPLEKATTFWFLFWISIDYFGVSFLIILIIVLIVTSEFNYFILKLRIHYLSNWIITTVDYFKIYSVIYLINEYKLNFISLYTAWEWLFIKRRIKKRNTKINARCSSSFKYIWNVSCANE